MPYVKNIVFCLFSLFILASCGGGGGDSKPTPPVAVEKDSDNDGIKDSIDQCPSEVGSASNNGCPEPQPEPTTDTDKDGLADSVDECVDEKGFESFNGCPSPKDTDFDGVADLDDQCVDQKGLAENSGCPAAIPEDAFYVALDGNDSNNGTVDQPFKTFAKAMTVLSAGDTLVIKEGRYSETLDIDLNGTELEPITVRAASGEKVLISATQYVNDWQLHEGSIYKTQVELTLGDVFNQVYYDGKVMDMARWPNNEDNDRHTVDAHPITGGDGSTINAIGLPDDLAGGYVWYLGAHSGASWTRVITEYAPGTITYDAIDVNKWPFNPHNPGLFRNGNYGRIYVFGRLSLLDHAREWYYDTNTQTLYLQTPDGSEPEHNSVQVPVKLNTIEVDGDYVKVQGVEVFGGAVRLNGNYNSLLDSVVSNGSQRLDELDNTDAQMGDGSVVVNGHHATIKGNIIEYGSNNGVRITSWGGRGDGSRVENNFIRYFNTLGIHAPAIRSGSKDVKILKNTISYVGRDGISSFGTHCEIAYNDVSQGMLINNDGGVFYTVGNDASKHTEIHHNWFHDFQGPEYADGRAAGIYLDNNSKGYLVHHNVVWNITWTGLQLNWANFDNYMYHNTIWNPGEAMGSWVNGYDQGDNRVWNNYSSIGDWLQDDAFDLEANIIDEESPFMDIEGVNFMPKPESVLIDQAIDIANFDKVTSGAGADVGAYERGGVQWTAGVNAIEDEE
ncbi:right-handed parallel beta-helix repeat-containing protein [Paraglaciecola aquimarina]|uniref:Right-handed parallel beta-helix repeat-containing protein n=1 Tax=Paraglaciecola algarum TaxID=3050085 RepID=A0ABS9D199_9ALTE|nr:right-handed parallel beta-helix repeat-containing protein [Paraglaciecola sp. G1-23]MCF2946641.1 right-handed parallel beta-helix repeat-containing protein [Paraglaciecola sp. G1-23]